MYKKSFIIREYINTEIKVGDKVKFWDGSGISCDKSNKDIYIVIPYKELTRSGSKLMDIEGEVVEVGIKNRVISGSVDTAYLQDITVRLGSGLFRTCSKFVRPIVEGED